MRKGFIMMGKENQKPHLRLTASGWHAKSGLNNAIAASPKEALSKLSEFINSQRK